MDIITLTGNPESRRDDPDTLINDLLLETGVGLKQISDYAQAHREEIRGAKNIFRMQTRDDVARCCALQSMLYKGEAGDLFAYFLEEHKTNGSVSEKIVDEYKVELLAAIVYAPSFFTLACNAFGIAAWKREHDSDIRLVAATEMQTPETVFAMAALGAGADLPEFSEPIILRPHSLGEAEMEGGALHLQGRGDAVHFVFEFDDSFVFLPHYVGFHFLTKKDGAHHYIRLTNTRPARGKKLFIDSGAVVRGVDFSADIEPLDFVWISAERE